MVVNSTVYTDKRTLDAELRMLRSCLAVIQDPGYSKEARSEEFGLAKVHINFIEENVCKYPEQEGEEFKRLRELFKTLSSFFVNKKS